MNTQDAAALPWQKYEEQIEKLAEGHDPLWKYGQVFVLDLETDSVSAVELPKPGKTRGLEVEA